MIVKELWLGKDLDDYLGVVADLQLLESLLSLVSQDAPMEHVALLLSDSDLLKGLPSCVLTMRPYKRLSELELFHA